MTLHPGARLGPYEIHSALGAGGMGEVYRARDTRLARDVAVKVLPSGFSADPERLDRFEQEARAAAALNHPNILAGHDVGTHDGAPYIVSELLDGETLRERLAGGPLPIRKAIEYAVQVAHGLAAAHEKGIIHRDLKPENVFLTTDDRVKILDFGLAKLTEPEPALAGATALPTTPPQYAGTYTDRWYGDVAIALEGGTLVMRFTKTPIFVGDMEHWQHDTFVVKWRDRELRADAFVTFALNPDGSIDQAKMRAVSSSTDFSFDFQDLLLEPKK